MEQPRTSPRDEYLRQQLAYRASDYEHSPNNRIVISVIHAFIVEAVKGESDKRAVHLLDVGAGSGEMSTKLAPHITSNVGIEPSSYELALHASRPGQYLIHGVGEDLSLLRSQSRNVVMLSSVLDHCCDWQRAIQECLRVLRPGGLLLVSLENCERPSVLLRRALGLKIAHEGHLAFFGFNEFGRFLESQGLTLEQRATTGYLFGFHALTRRLPLRVSILTSMNKTADRLGRIVRPGGGHLFFYAARKAGTDGRDQDQAEAIFQCRACATAFTFGDRACNRCGLELCYPRADTIEGLTEATIRQLTQ